MTDSWARRSEKYARERWLQPAGIWRFAGFMGDGYGNAEEEVSFLDLNKSDTPSLDREREVVLALQGGHDF